MYCPECGHEAGDAKYCPECGADLGAVRGALQAKGAPGKTTGQAGSAAGAAGADRKPVAPPSGGFSPRLLWAIVAVVAVAVVAAVVLVSDDGEEPASGSEHGATPAAGATPVAVDLSGNYRELVERGHDLYDRGDELIRAQDFEQGVEYFAAAAQVYEAAWAKEPGDPNVGTDWATSLFYSGDFDGAIRQVMVVLEDNADFQPAWFNLGNYLEHKARVAEQAGETDEAARLYDQARDAYSKAAEIDSDSETGVAAAARATELTE